jgi:hypothetical protein
VHSLTFDAEGLSAGREHADAGTRGEYLVDRGGRVIDDVLAVVHEQQGASRSEAAHHLRGGGHSGIGHEVDSRCDDLPDE